MESDASASSTSRTTGAIAGSTSAAAVPPLVDNEHVPTGSNDATTGDTRRAVLRTVGLDVVGPLVIFRVCRSTGLPTVWSLVLSGCPPALGVMFDWVRWRTLEVVGAVVLAGIVLALVLAVVSGSPKVLLLDAAATTAAFGVACLVSLTRRRPLIFYFAQAFYGGRHSAAGIEMDTEYVRYQEARAYWRTVTVVWCVTYLLEAAGVVAVVVTWSTGAALTFNRITPTLATAMLVAWTIWWGNRLRTQKPDEESAEESADEPATG
jgi:hypothetical protein